MSKKKVKHFLALILAASMMIPSVPARAETGGAEPVELADEVTVPEPYYEFTFDKGVTGGKVENEGTKTGITATISGDGAGLGVVDNEVRGNKVLNLPGGGLNKGSLLLPDNMFDEVTNAGFAFSFWINIDKDAKQYSRIFSATSFELNSNNGDNGAWNAPEFTFVVGAEGADDMAAGKAGYNSSIMLNNRSSQLKLVWEKQFSKGEWQHVTVSVSPTDYAVYLDGQQVGIKYDRNNNKSNILASLFANSAQELKTYTHNAIGRSVYSTDNDIKAQMDEFRFYNTALTSAQAKAAYDSYAVRDTVLNALRDKIAEAQSKSISFYTEESYGKLQTAVSEGEAGLANPVTEANVNRLIDNLNTALSELVFYEGITATTAFSNTQLDREVTKAKVILSQDVLSADSQQQLQAAVTSAEQALKGTDQNAVDEALKAMRAAVRNLSYGATLHFNANPANSKSELLHGSTGFLYGVSEIGVPTADLISAIQPKILVQKAADGQQHPSGDGYRLTPYLKECGVENIQIYLQDYYLEWPYEYNGISDYKGKVDKIVRKMVAGKTEAEIAAYSFVLFNEPDGIWYQNVGSNQQVQQTFCNDWLTIYNTVKSINPNIKVAGPNFSVYNTNAYRVFFDFCKQNNCLPEYITWHELQKDKLTSFKSHCDEVKGYVKTYYAGSGIEPVLFVNETVNFDDVGDPGALVNWLAIFDEEDTYASLPYWGLANSLNELAADTNKPNGAWWVYKWYAQMTGKKTPLTLENIGNPSAYGRLYGLTSVDETAGIIYSLFGGQAGKQTVSIENINAAKMFRNADKAHVKLYSTKYTGHHGFADDIPVEFEGNIAFTGDDLVFTVPDAELMDAYYAVITPATGEAVSAIPSYETNWEQTYEAENAQMIGGARSYKKENGGDLARSNRAEVGSLDTESDGVKFTVNVPKTGRYRLNVYYTSQAPQVNPQTLEYVGTGGQNRAIGALCRHTLAIDNGQPQEIVYDSTVKWGYYNYKTIYVDLTEGNHTIQLMYKGNSQKGKEEKSILCAMLDKIDLAWAPDEPAVIRVEPEELTGSQEGFALSQEGSYSGAGSAAGSGTFDFYVCAPRDGYYTVGTMGSGSATLSKSRVNYASDAKAESAVSIGWLELFNITMGNQDAGKVYLTAGMNRFRITGTGLVLDLLTFTEEPGLTADNSQTIEAEDCILATSNSYKNDKTYNYLLGSKAVPEVIDTEYASGGKAVEGFRGGSDNSLTLKVNVPEAGDYKLSVFYSNDEPAPVMKTQAGKDYVHPYNTDLVERYMQISTNGETPQTVYFKNTFCWDTYKNTIVDVKLKKGENTITFANDNSYKFSSVQDDFTPRMDKFVVVPAKQTGVDYDALKVAEVVELMDAIGSVTAENVDACKEKIDEARKAYNALTEAQKEKVGADKLKVLTDAEAKYDELTADQPASEKLKGELAAAIQEAQAEALVEAAYTEDGWKVYKDALENLQAVSKKQDATKGEVQAALKAYRTARANLTPVKEAADKTELNKAIESAKKFKEEDYTPSTWQDFQTALNAANAVAEKSDATQQEVDDALSALEEKQSVLKKAVTKITITNKATGSKTFKIAAGKKVTLKATAAPKDASSSVTWSVDSKSKNFATVNKKTGAVTIKKNAGGKKVSIIATAKDGSKKTQKVTITVMKNAVTKVTLKAAKKVKAGRAVTIKATVKTNGKSANKALFWNIDKKSEKYASINSKGKLKTKNTGKGKKVTVTATATDGTNKKAKVIITLTK